MQLKKVCILKKDQFSAQMQTGTNMQKSVTYIGSDFKHGPVNIQQMEFPSPTGCVNLVWHKFLTGDR